MSDTKTKLLDEAQALVQVRGFNAFSFKDLAQAVGIRTPSVHYHFETKSELGEALLGRYIEELEEQLQELDALHSPKARLAALIQSYRSTESRGLACVCGSLASDVETLPESMQRLVERYLERTESWVATQLEQGKRNGDFAPRATSSDLAELLVSSLQGALFLARARGKVGSMVDSIERAFWIQVGGTSTN
ncbi:MAG: TetR/AcrR family transcriptional regulator [Myxococcota bacterium]